MASLPDTHTMEEDLVEEQPPFRLFDLPPELRLRIYEYALAPTGVLSLTTTATKRHAVLPIITPQILATCTQLHHEAKSILYSENEICITVDAHDTCWPAISERRLPQTVLQKLQHICLILDATANFRASYSDVDFAALEALISLQTLRVAMVCTPVYYEVFLVGNSLLEAGEESIFPQILERVPAAATVTYGIALGTQQHDLVRSIVAMRSVGSGRGIVNGRGKGSSVMEVSGDVMKAAVQRLEGMVQGSKSARTVDVFAEARAMNTGGTFWEHVHEK